MRSFPVRLITQQDDSRTERPGFHKFQIGFIPIIKQALAAAQNDRINQQVVFIHQGMFDQRADQGGAAGDQDVQPGRLFQPGNFICNISPDDGRMLPLGFFQSGLSILGRKYTTNSRQQCTSDIQQRCTTLRADAK